MTVSDLLARTTSAELTEWMALSRLEADEAKQEELNRRTGAGMVAQR